MAVNKSLRIPRSILAEMTNNNPQAIKVMEGLQLSAFDLLPADIQQIIQKAADDAMQAAMIANQLRQQLSPYLQVVSVPMQAQAQLQAVSSSIDCNHQLQAV